MHTDATLDLLGARDTTRVSHAVWQCYRSVFGNADDYDTWNRDLFERHSQRDGYRLVVASAGSVVRGFGWGYIGEHGQYWTDLVRAALAPEVAAEWVGGHFELVELGVHPEHRGAGLGGKLHDAMLAGVDRRCLLSTTDDTVDPAVQLYRRRRWVRLGTLSPGVQVMGRDSAHRTPSPHSRQL